MIFIKQLERFNKLDKLIKAENTGTPIELANKLEISRSHLYRLLSTFKDYGAEIDYSRKTKSFYYTKPLNFNVLFPSSNTLSDTKMEKIIGGFNKNTIQSFFMRRNKTTFTTYFT